MRACASFTSAPAILSQVRNLNAEAHKAMGLESPTHTALANTMKGIRRTKGTAPVQKAAALTDDIRAIVDATDMGIIGTRDRALILLGFAGAFRRSERVRLDADDCAFARDDPNLQVRFGPDKLGDDVGIDEEAVHTLTGPG